jgi:2'-5' RNA ligase
MRSVDDAGPERLFIGIPVPDRASEQLIRQLPPVLPGKVSPRSNWHFTLKFLGRTEAHSRDRLIEELRSVELGRPFEMAFDSLGAFPGAWRARVLWLGVGRGRERLESIAARVEAAATAAGFPAETRKFAAHLTVARIRPPESVTRVLAEARAIDASMLVDEVILYRSETGGLHSRYTPIARIALTR